jgi:signal transduction histidine kinase
MSLKLGGEMSVVSATGSGTSIAVRIPVDHAS